MNAWRVGAKIRRTIGVALPSFAVLCWSATFAYAQAGDTTKARVDSAANGQPEEITEIREPEQKRKAAPPLLWKGLIQGGFVGRRDAAENVPTSEFLLREAQVSVEGDPSPGIHFFIEANFPGPGEKVELNDAFVTLDLTKTVQLVAGQLRVPLNRPAVSARGALFVAEPRAAGPFQRKARDRGVNLVLTPFNGRLLYEQALVNGNGILAGELGNDDSGLLLEGRLIWFATGAWPVPLPAQTDLRNSRWSTFFKAGWASGNFDKGVSETLAERVRENTWNVGQAILGKGLYTYWQYGQALAGGVRDFDSRSFSITSGYAFPLRRYFPFVQAAPRALRAAWLEPKLQYETLRVDDPGLPAGPTRELYRFGINYYPLGTPDIRIMVDNELVVRPGRAYTLLVFLHYMF